MKSYIVSIIYIHIFTYMCVCTCVYYSYTGVIIGESARTKTNRRDNNDNIYTGIKFS